MLTEKDVNPTPTPSPRIGRLDSLKAVRLEMAKVYREARMGTTKTEDASRFVYILLSLAKLIETGDLESRIQQLERSLELQRKFPLQNGGNHHAH